ncbi:MAG TPA: protein kinase [Thermoanaerobaculia bacterium]|nr:protein kinase [Thermoanaerobaculia bacterium]
MASNDPFSPGSALLTYKLGQRISTSVWQAEDTRNGKKVAIKLLSRQLPKDAAKRESVVRDARLGAALYHASLVNVQEVAVAGEALILVMEWFDGQPLSARVRTKPLDRAEYFRLAYQIGDALKLLHAKNLVHGNVSGDSVLIAANGQAKLTGLNLSNLIARQGQPSAFQQKGNDARSVAYLAPEQISNQGITLQTDIFSLGLVLYEAATGRLAYQGANPAEVARKVVNEQPPSPKSINPNIDAAVLGLMGHCLFKDPFRRYKDMKAFLEDVVRADPEAQKFAASVGKPGAGAQQGGQKRSVILFVADVAGEADSNASARMQQILGEAVYLFDGKVLDPFGPRLIAELPTVEAALEAGRKGEFDFSPEQQDATPDQEPVAVRLLLHAGEVEVRDGKVGGAAVDKAIEVLKLLDPLRLYVSEDFTKRGRGNVRLRDSGAKGGVKLFTIVATEAPSAGTMAVPEAEPDEVGEVEEAEATASIASAAAKKKKNFAILAAAAAVAVVILGGAGVMLFSKSKPAPVAPVTITHPRVEVPTGPKSIFLQPFTVEGTDATLADRANQVRLAAIEMLRAMPDIRVADAPGPDVTAVTTTVRAGATGPEIAVGGPAAVPMLDVASGIQTVVDQVSRQLNIAKHPVAVSAAAYNAFAEAVVANAANDAPKTEKALRGAIKADPNFVPAQLLAMHFYANAGKEADAAAAAKQVLADDPSNLEAARIVAHNGLTTGDLTAALGAYAAILKKDPANVEALNIVGRYAWSAGDNAKFNAALQRLSASSPSASSIQAPDLLLASGKIDAAADAYYDVEEKIQNNPALALKIGRLAVLRHSASIADIELKKLQESDPNYGLHILKAYLAAQSGSQADADNELKAALAASKPGDDYYTNVAEVAVIGGDAKGALAALQKAAARKEPTVSYILSDPLFVFLQTDPDFQKLRGELVAQQAEIRTALASVPLT